MVISKINENEYIKSRWSGGITTQLGIYPKAAVYADRDFIWRLSSATVDLEESDFTVLPDYDRIIMTLKGGLDLSHNGGKVLHLDELQPHSFDGADHTSSRGRVVDFNLMMRKNACRGTVEALKLMSYQERLVKGGSKNNCCTLALYAYKGDIRITSQNEKLTLNWELHQGETLMLEECTCDVKLLPTEDSIVIASHIEIL